MKLDSDSLDRLKNIQILSNKAVQLIKQILDFSRKSDVDKIPINLVSLIKNFLLFIERTLPENIAIHSDFSKEEIFIEGDPTQLQQIFLNLTLNSRDAMPKGGLFSFSLVEKTIGQNESVSMKDLKPGEWVIITIKDTGEGIPSNVIHRIFEPYFSTKFPGKSAGLGLSQVYGLVKLQNGLIDVTSQFSVGTDFTIYFPTISYQDELDKIDVREELISTDEKKCQFQEKTILIVEDDAYVLKSISMLLEKMGCKVLTSINGIEGFKKYKDNLGKIDLILSDMIMPEMNGAELFEKVKEINPHTKMVIMSGYDFTHVAKQLNQTESLKLLQKPFTIKQIKDIIKSL